VVIGEDINGASDTVESVSELVFWLLRVLPGPEGDVASPVVGNTCDAESVSDTLVCVSEPTSGPVSVVSRADDAGINGRGSGRCR
jgi:hypothetical protein